MFGVIYQSIRQAARAVRTTPLAVSEALRGLRSHAGGRTWEYHGSPGEPVWARPVVLDDGRWFPSGQAAARALTGTNTPNLCSYIRNGWLFRGHRIRYADRPATNP